MIRTNIYLTTRQVEFLKLVRSETGIPAAETIRRLLDERIENSKTLEKGKKENDTGEVARII